MQQILGDQVSGIGSLHLARPKPQQSLSKAVWRAAERIWMADGACTLKDKRRLLACGGREAGWVTAMPSAREYQLTNDQWRDAVSSRLHLPLSFLVADDDKALGDDSFQDRPAKPLGCGRLAWRGVGSGGCWRTGRGRAKAGVSGRLGCARPGHVRAGRVLSELGRHQLQQAANKQ